MKRMVINVNKYKVSVKKLRRIIEPEEMISKSQLTIPIEMVGQERITKALDLILSAENKFHGIILAESAQLVAVAIRDYLQKKIKEQKQKGKIFGLKDYCYVYNFQDPTKPSCIIFPAGEGEVFKKRIEEIPKKLENLISKDKERLSEDGIDLAFKKLFKIYAQNKKVRVFLKGLKRHIKKNKDVFLPQTSQASAQEGINKLKKELELVKRKLEKITETLAEEKENVFVPFKVNLLVNNKGRDLPPVRIEISPSYCELFGKLERKKINDQEIMVDHTMLRPGIFHQVNGGYLILDLTDIYDRREPVLLGLKTTFSENQLKIRHPFDEYGISYEGKTLCPQPIPLELKVIAILHPNFYYSLSENIFDQELLKMFKIRGEFKKAIDAKPENLRAFSSWMDQYIKERKVFPLEVKAKAKIIEVLLRQAESQERLIWNLDQVKNLIQEAYLYAKEENANFIQVKHIKKAVQEKIYRSNLIEQELKIKIKEGKVLIYTRGEKVGQINSLAVLDLGDYQFAFPFRVTATTAKSEKVEGEKIIDIEREVGFADETHAKAMEILKAFFQERYGQDQLLRVEARIWFDQEWEPTQGPSASAAELIALLSSLAGKPIKQNLAITGTVNKEGKIEAIGGVNQKIEGFYEICKDQGLTGDQGVIIPKVNQKDLMLKEEVVEAIKEGKFHLFAIEHIDQGIEILTGLSVKKINALINKKLKKWSR